MHKVLIQSVHWCYSETYSGKDMQRIVVDHHFSLGEDPIHTASQFNALPLILYLACNLITFLSKHHTVASVRVCLNGNLILCKENLSQKVKIRSIQITYESHCSPERWCIFLNETLNYYYLGTQIWINAYSLVWRLVFLCCRFFKNFLTISDFKISTPIMDPPWPWGSYFEQICIYTTC